MIPVKIDEEKTSFTMMIKEFYRKKRKEMNDLFLCSDKMVIARQLLDQTFWGNNVMVLN